MFGEIDSSMIDGGVDPRVCWVAVMDVGAARVLGEVEGGPNVSGKVEVLVLGDVTAHGNIGGARLVEIIMCARLLSCWDEGM